MKPGSFQSLFNVDDKHFIREDKLPEPGPRTYFSFTPSGILSADLNIRPLTVTLEAQTLNRCCSLELERPLVVISGITDLSLGGVPARAF